MELMDQIVIKTVQSALRIDSTTSTRPMNQEVGSPSDISSAFDNIAYDKSGSVIRMVEGFISTEVFRRGLNIYLNNMYDTWIAFNVFFFYSKYIFIRQFQAAQPMNLYSAWQEALEEADVNLLPANEDIESVLTTWDSNAGYPLITVNRSYSDGSVTLGQVSISFQDKLEIIWICINFREGF